MEKTKINENEIEFKKEVIEKKSKIDLMNELNSLEMKKQQLELKINDINESISIIEAK